MAKVNLKGVHAVKSMGRTYYYAWRGRGAPRLRGEPGTSEFVSELNDALATRSQSPKGRIAWLCGLYRASSEFQALAPSTRRHWVTWVDRVQDHFGPLSLLQFDRPTIRVHIRRWRDGWKSTPRTADYGLQVLSRILSFAVGEGLLQLNPCIGIPRLYSVSRSEMIWTDDDLGRLLAVASKEVGWAAQLAMLTGIRQGDLLRLGWSHVSSDAIEFKTGKSGNRRSVVIPLYDELRQLLARIPKRATTVLTNAAGKPWGTGFGSSWNKAVRRAGLELHFHDLRGSAATRFYGRLTNIEIATVLGWSEAKVERMIDRYVKRDELLRDKIRRLNANAS